MVMVDGEGDEKGVRSCMHETERPLHKSTGNSIFCLTLRTAQLYHEIDFTEDEIAKANKQEVLTRQHDLPAGGISLCTRIVRAARLERARPIQLRSNGDDVF